MAKTLKPTALIICAYDGEDYFNETAPGYSEDQAYLDIRQGQAWEPQQVLLITATGCEDITTRIAERIASDLEDGVMVAKSAAAFAEQHGGYVPHKPRAEIVEMIAEYRNDCAREDRVTL
jgi:hypothetical protein